MPRIQSESILRFLRKWNEPGTNSASDAGLLERYVRSRDEAAFELLLWRHGGLVLSLCREVLQDAFEAEDAFQATFLVLARKARSISKRESLPAWLYQVAYRIALRASVKNAKRRAIEKSGLGAAADLAARVPEDGAFPPEWRRAVYEEIARLPSKYRSPLVLCHLEGKTHEQAAQQLGWPKGTVSGRVARAREMLRRRLVRRGLAVSAPVALPLLSASGAGAAVSPALIQATWKTALLFAAGKSGGISPHVALLVKGALLTMLVRKVKWAAFAVLGVVFLSVGVGAVGHVMASSDQPVPTAEVALPAEPPTRSVQEPKAPDPLPEKVRKDQRVFRIASPTDGVLLLIGSEIKPGEKVAAKDAATVRSGQDLLKYRPLREGDVVKEGQPLARLDDRLARIELERAEVKLAAAQAEARAAKAALDEADAHVETAQKLFERKILSGEELRSKVFARNKYREEAAARKDGAKLAELGVRRARILLEMHEIRSPVAGVVRRILRSPGEGVKALDAVVEITPAQ
jgi:RNA polymerase sigma factor (sigma-70 family)